MSMEEYMAAMTGSHEFRCRLWHCGAPLLLGDPENTGCGERGRLGDEDSNVDSCTSISILFDCLPDGLIHRQTVGAIEALLDFSGGPIGPMGQQAVEQICSGDLDFGDYLDYYQNYQLLSMQGACVFGPTSFAYMGFLHSNAPSAPLTDGCLSPADEAAVMAAAAVRAGVECGEDLRDLVGCEGRAAEEVIREALAGLCEANGELRASAGEAIAEGLASNGLDVSQALRLAAESLGVSIDDLGGLYSCSGNSALEVATAMNHELCVSRTAFDLAFSTSNWYRTPDLEDRIDTEDPSLSARLKCILDAIELENADYWCSVAMPRFGGPSSRFDLRFTEEIYPRGNASTRKPQINGDPNFRIRFSTTYVEEACEIDIMRTAVHEMIHAELLAFAIDNSMDPLNFGEAYQYYVDNYRSDADWNHNAMAELYLDKIAHFLENMYGGLYTQAEYRAFAWSGLSEYYNQGTIESITDAWNELSESERNQIRQTQASMRNSCSDIHCDG